jgi:hypothetical protein
VIADLQAKASKGRGHGITVALLCHSLSGTIIILSAVFSFSFVKLCHQHQGSFACVGPIEAMCAWDGAWYAEIVKRGYGRTLGLWPI